MFDLPNDTCMRALARYALRDGLAFCDTDDAAQYNHELERNPAMVSRDIQAAFAMLDRAFNDDGDQIVDSDAGKSIQQALTNILSLMKWSDYSAIKLRLQHALVSIDLTLTDGKQGASQRVEGALY